MQIRPLKGPLGSAMHAGNDSQKHIENVQLGQPKVGKVLDKALAPRLVLDTYKDNWGQDCVPNHKCYGSLAECWIPEEFIDYRQLLWEKGYQR
jgi:hypothetical protein